MRGERALSCVTTVTCPVIPAFCPMCWNIASKAIGLVSKHQQTG
jgi:hypothetical protein